MMVHKLALLLICVSFSNSRLTKERDNDKERTIVNGLPSPKRDFYVIVAVTELLPNKQYVFYVCGGGSLIKDNWIVTSAHCLNNSVYTLVEVRDFTGADNIGKVYRGKKYISPEWNYSRDKKTNVMTVSGDIALFKLNGSVSPDLEPIMPCYALVVEERSNHTLIAMGMGSSRPGERPTENYNGLVLNEAVMQEPSDDDPDHEKCTGWAVNSDASKEICTYSPEGNAVCVADGGGPLVKLSNYNRKDVCLYGTISYGDLECKQGVTAFTRVSSYKDWIQMTLNSEADDYGDDADEETSGLDETKKKNIHDMFMEQLRILIKTPDLFTFEKRKLPQ
ncbi:brachyurin-like isoform X2 [Convolutriloba macropyga]|uniref:brachyurin-like isoform X2 n=1 Tax=Convolutriloba macropyga TaxID=536237 RepID=UPI003F522B16